MLTTNTHGDWRTRRALTGLLLVTAIVGTGCASFNAGHYSADYEALDGLKRSGLRKATVDKVNPVDPEAKVNQLTLRGARFVAGESTFSTYLERALIADLGDARLYDASSTRRISVTLLKNELDISGLSQGLGSIEAEVVVNEGSRQVMRKKYAATTQFESSFAAAVAVPKAQAEYPVLVRALLSRIYRDGEFVQALRAP